MPISTEMETLLSGGTPQQSTESQAGGEGASTEETQASSPAAGQQAPVAGSADTTGTQTTEQQAASSPQGSETTGQSPDGAPTAEAIKGELGGSEAPEKRAERIDRDYRAQSTENRRLNDQTKAQGEVLKDLGVKFVQDGDTHRLVQVDKKGKVVEPTSPAYDDWNRKDQRALDALLEETPDPEEVAKFFAERAGERVINVTAPSADTVVPTLTEVRLSTAIDAVAQQSEKYPNVKSHADQGYINDVRVAAPKAVQRAFDAEPEYMIGLFSHTVDAAIARLSQNAQQTLTQQEEKNKQADSAAAHGSGSAGGTAHIGSAGNDQATKDATALYANPDSYQG